MSDASVHGASLVESVLERISGEGLAYLNHYEDAVPLSEAALADLRFPNGLALSPALRRWLSFDAGLLGFFEDPAKPSFKARTIAEFAEDVYGAGELARKFGALSSTLPGLCFGLPMGKGAKRFLYVGEQDTPEGRTPIVDAFGEHPVLVLDPTDPPFVCVEYPGIDLFLAEKARLLHRRSREFGSFGVDEVYGPRMQTHRDRLFDGRPSIKYGEEGFAPLIETDLDAEQTLLLAPHQPIPEGYRVVEEVPNPMFGGVMRLVAPIR